MTFLHLLLLLQLVATVYPAQELVAEAFENWDFGHRNSHAFELLIFVVIGILVTFLLLVLCVFIFRALMICCGNYSNTTTDFELPKLQESQAVSPNSTEEDQTLNLQSILVHSELIKLQGDDTPLTPLGLTKQQRGELARLLGAGEP